VKFPDPRCRYAGRAVREHLKGIARLLRRNGEPVLALPLETATAGSDKVLNAFLVSDDLWGGAGSLADSALVQNGRREGRRRIEELLIALGEEQMRRGLTNVRTASWVAAFTKWRDAGV